MRPRIPMVLRFVLHLAAKRSNWALPMTKLNQSIYTIQIAFCLCFCFSHYMRANPAISSLWNLFTWSRQRPIVCSDLLSAQHVPFLKERVLTLLLVRILTIVDYQELLHSDAPQHLRQETFSCSESTMTIIAHLLSRTPRNRLGTCTSVSVT